MSKMKLLRKMMMDNISFSPRHESAIEDLQKLPNDCKIIDIEEFIEKHADKMVRFSDAVIQYDEWDLSKDEIAQTLHRYNILRDKVFPPEHNFIYIKLSTGGFAGYDSRLGKEGSKIYPILRITLQYRNSVFDHYINPRGAEEHISESTKLFLSKDKVLEKALKSEVGIAEINLMVKEWFKENNIPVHAPTLNRYRYGVHANVDFNNKFIFNQLPELKKQLGPKSIDINLILTNLTTIGHYITPLNLYGDDATTYINKMAEYHKKFIDGMSYV